VEERTKDKIEDGGAAVVEAAASMVPIIGGAAAVLVNRAFGSAVQRRNERLFEELTDRVEDLVARLDASEADQVLGSEEFQAAVHRVFRASQETASSEKRRLLQNALLNGYLRGQSPVERDDFLVCMIRYAPEHVVVLQAMEEIMSARDETLEDAALAVARHLIEAVPRPVVDRSIKDLVDDGLLVRCEKSKVERNGGRIESLLSREAEQLVSTEVRHDISDRGKRFLSFIADPEPLAD